MNYYCLNCKKEVETELIRKRIRCPHCGFKILIKKTIGMGRKVKAR